MSYPERGRGINPSSSPDEFESYRIKASEMGFKAVASGPFVRSSYMAEELGLIPRPRSG